MKQSFIKTIIVSVIILLNIAIVPRAFADTCTDSDGGVSYFTKGYIDTKSTISTGYYSDQCWGGTNELHEWSCNGIKSVETIYVCPDGCIDGACIKKTAEKTSSCTDSDYGINYYKKGTIEYQEYGPNGNLTISSEPKDGCVNAIIEGNLKNNILREYYCDENNKLQYKHYECPNGCSNGICRSSNEPDNNTDNISKKTILTLPANDLIFLTLSSVVLIICALTIIVAKKSESNKKEMIAKTKICLKCGKITDNKQAKCPACGSENLFSRK